MRLLITGSRNWDDEERLWHVLDKTAESLAHYNKDRYVLEGLRLVSGHAHGADALGEAWFTQHSPLENLELWHADWKGLGKRAGIVRNVAMVDSQPDSCVAFIMPCDKGTCDKPGLHGSHGAVHCADYAEAQGIPTARYYGGGLV